MIGGVRAKDPVIKPLPLAELIRRLQELEALDGLDRARLAKAELGAVARATIAAAGDEGVWQAKRRGMSYNEIVAAMDYSDDGPVSRAISRHNRRLRGEL